MKRFDRIWETTATTGTGSYVLGGARSAIYRAFGDVLTNGQATEYFVRNSDGSIWERNWGVYNSGADTLTRNLIQSSTGSAINWTSGDKDIFMAPSAALQNIISPIVRATTRPGWLETGDFWVDTDASPPTLYYYDGSIDIPIGTFDATTHAFNPIGYSADAGASAGPTSDLYRNSASPADADDLGDRTWSAKDDSGTKRVVAGMRASWVDSNGSLAEAKVTLRALIAGSFASVLSWGKRLILFRSLELAKGTTVASASTTDIWANADGNFIDVSGTATINTFGTAPQAGATRRIRATGAWTVSNNSFIVVQGAANYTAASGDILEVTATTTTTFAVTIQRSAGALFSGSIAAQSDMETGTDLTKAVTPGRVKFSPFVTKAWVLYTSVTTTAIRASAGVSSLGDNSAGNTTINFSTAFSSVDYAGVATGEQTTAAASVAWLESTNRAVGSIRVLTINSGASFTDMVVSAAFWGDL